MIEIAVLIFLVLAGFGVVLGCHQIAQVKSRYYRVQADAAAAKSDREQLEKQSTAEHLAAMRQVELAHAEEKAQNDIESARLANMEKAIELEAKQALAPTLVKEREAMIPNLVKQRDNELEIAKEREFAKIRVEAEEKIKLFSDPDYIKAMIDKQRAANEAHRAKIKMNKDYMSEWLAQEDYNGQEDNTYEFGTPEPPFEI